MPLPAGLRFRWQGLAAVMLTAFCWGLPLRLAQGAPDAFKEYEVKAVFLYNFAQFVEWPTGTFVSADSPLIIGVLGGDAFADTLEQTVKGETVKGRPLLVRKFHDKEDITACHVLFVSRSQEGGLRDLHDFLEDSGSLTVGECRDFAVSGGVINFFLQANKIRFEINPVLAQRKGLKISSQLLSLGKIVGTDESRGKR